MSIELNFPFDNPSNYSFDSAKIDVTGGETKLKLEKDNVDFVEDFDNDTGFTYDNTKAEFVGGEVKQKDQRPAGYTLYDDFSDSANANWGIGTLTRNLQNATVAGGLLDCTGGTPKRAYYNSDNLTNLDDEIVIDIKIYPDFNNTPGESTYLVHIFQATLNSIQIYMVSTGSITIRAIDNAGGYAINRTIVKNDWIQDQEYRLILFLKSGDSRCYLDGVIKFTDYNTWDRDIGNPILFVGSNQAFSSNGHFKFGEIYIGTNVDYVTDFSYAATIYVSNAIILPEMEHTGVGTIQLFNSFSTTEVENPRYLLQIGRSGDYLYWNGAAWVISNETYAQANDASTFNTNCGSLPVSGEEYGQFQIVFPDSNTQNAVSELTANLQVDIGYYIDNPTNTFNTTFRHQNLEGFEETAVKPTDTEIKYILTKNGVLYYWDTSNWVVSDGTYAQANTAAEIEANKGSFTLIAVNTQIIMVLHTSDRENTPVGQNVKVLYDFAGNEDDINKCIVWGYNKKINGEVDESPFKVQLSQNAVKYPDYTILSQDIITVTPNNITGYWEVELIETESMLSSIYYRFIFDKIVIKKDVPNEDSKAFWELSDA